MLKLCANHIVSFLLSLSDIPIDSETKEVYVYGLECIFHNIVIVFILSIIGLLTNSFVSIVVWLSSFVLLRHNAGGYHAPTHFSCITSSILLGIGNIYITKAFSFSRTYAFISFLFALVFCLLLAPTQVSKHSLSSKDQNVYKLKSIFIILTGYSVSHFVSPELAASILYAFLSCSILLIIAKIKLLVRK